MSHRCLLVEDDVSVAESVVALLGTAGIECAHVTNYEEAVGRLTSPNEHFCFVVCDLGIPAKPGTMKPEMELGVTLVGHARKLFPGKNPDHEGAHWLPIIILSSGPTYTFRRAMRAGATDNISKPLGSDEVGFNVTVQMWLDKAKRTDHADCGEADRLARMESTRTPLPPAAALADAAPPSPAKVIVLGIPGRTRGGSSDVTIDGQTGRLQHRMFAGLLRLVEGRLAGRFLTPHKDLGAQLKAGWKDSSNIQLKLNPLLGDRTLIENIHATGYRLADHVELGVLDVTPYVSDEGGPLASAARDIAGHIARRVAPLNAGTEVRVDRKVEGKKNESRGKSR
jgi:CheY-like chemotaxis protein